MKEFILLTALIAYALPSDSLTEPSPKCVSAPPAISISPTVSELPTASASPAISALSDTQILHIAQELLDAVVTGDTTVWKKYMADDGFITEEDGVIRSKQEQLRFMRPTPPAYTRTITISHPVLRIFEHTAVLSIIPLEHLAIGGQSLNTSYNETDVFVLRRGQWQLLSSHVAEILSAPNPMYEAPPSPESYTGTYQLTDGINYVVTWKDGHLLGTRSGRSPQQLYPESPEVFYSKELLAHRKIFVRDGTGKVMTMIDRRAGNDLIYTRVR